MKFEIDLFLMLITNKRQTSRVPASDGWGEFVCILQPVTVIVSFSLGHFAQIRFNKIVLYKVYIRNFHLNISLTKCVLPADRVY